MSKLHAFSMGREEGGTCFPHSIGVKPCRNFSCISVKSMEEGGSRKISKSNLKKIKATLKYIRFYSFSRESYLVSFSPTKREQLDTLYIFIADTKYCLYIIYCANHTSATFKFATLQCSLH